MIPKVRKVRSIDVLEATIVVSEIRIEDATVAGERRVVTMPNR